MPARSVVLQTRSQPAQRLLGVRRIVKSFAGELPGPGLQSYFRRSNSKLNWLILRLTVVSRMAWASR